MSLSRRALIMSAGATAAVTAAAGVSSYRMGSADDYAAAVAVQRKRLGQDYEVKEIIRFATLAPNGHNTQPWRFRVSERTVEILPDFSRRTPVVDPDDHHLFVSLGCAAENLTLAAAAYGRQAQTIFTPENDGRIVIGFERAAAASSVLCDAIPHRQSTRADFDGRSVANADLSLLESAGRRPGVDLVLVTDAKRRAQIRDLVVAGNTAQMADPAFVAELKGWMRFNARQAMEAGDGIYGATGGNPNLPSSLGAALFDLVFEVKAENKKYVSQIDTSAGLAVFTAEKSDREHWVRVGQACQRFALQATALGLKISFVNQPVEVASMRPELAAAIGMPGRRPDIVMRFGYGPNLPMSSRRPADAVIVA